MSSSSASQANSLWHTWSGEGSEQLLLLPAIWLPSMCSHPPGSRALAMCSLGHQHTARDHVQRSAPACRAGEKEYYLASAFEEIYAPPSANLSLRGMSVGGSFLRGALEKVGACQWLVLAAGP